MIKFIIGLTLGIALGAAAHSQYINNFNSPKHRDDIESAYVMGCFIGVDMFLFGDRSERTCKDLKYYKERR